MMQSKPWSGASVPAVAVLLLLPVLAGCKKGAEAPADAGGPEVAGEAEGAPAEQNSGAGTAANPQERAEESRPDLVQRSFVPASIRLVEAGAEPRRALRYQPQDGTVRISEAEYVIDYGARSNITTTMRTRVSVLGSKEGVVGLDYEIEAYETVQQTGETAVPKPTGPLMKGRKGRVVTDARCLTRAASMDARKADAAFPLVEGVVEGMRMLCVPLPEEPVGKGARWTVRWTEDMRGLENNVEQTFTVANISGDRVELRYDRLETLKPGVMDTKDGPVVNEKREVRGSGTFTLAPGAGFAPVSGSYEARVETKVVLSGGGQTREQQNEYTLRSSIGPAKSP